MKELMWSWYCPLPVYFTFCQKFYLPYIVVMIQSTPPTNGAQCPTCQLSGLYRIRLPWIHHSLWCSCWKHLKHPNQAILLQKETEVMANWKVAVAPSAWIGAGIPGNGNPGMRTKYGLFSTWAKWRYWQSCTVSISIFVSVVRVQRWRCSLSLVAGSVEVTIAIATRIFCVCGEIYIYIYIVYLHVLQVPAEACSTRRSRQDQWRLCLRWRGCLHVSILGRCDWDWKFISSRRSSGQWTTRISATEERWDGGVDRPS